MADGSAAPPVAGRNVLAIHLEAPTLLAAHSAGYFWFDARGCPA